MPRTDDVVVDLALRHQREHEVCRLPVAPRAPLDEQPAPDVGEQLAGQLEDAAARRPPRRGRRPAARRPARRRRRSTGASLPPRGRRWPAARRNGSSSAHRAAPRRRRDAGVGGADDDGRARDGVLRAAWSMSPPPRSAREVGTAETRPSEGHGQRCAPASRRPARRSSRPCPLSAAPRRTQNVEGDRHGVHRADDALHRHRGLDDAAQPARSALRRRPRGAPRRSCGPPSQERRARARHRGRQLLRRVRRGGGRRGRRGRGAARPGVAPVAGRRRRPGADGPAHRARGTVRGQPGRLRRAPRGADLGDGARWPGRRQHDHGRPRLGPAARGVPRSSSLGVHRLKDIPDPQRLWQLTVPGLPTAFPSLRSLGAPGSLPTPPTPLVGRDVETAALRVAAVRTGPGWSPSPGPGGPARPGSRSRWRSSSRRPTPTGCTSSTSAVPPRRRSRGRRWRRCSAGRATTRATCSSHLGDRRVLLVLDNLEQLRESGGELVAAR